MCTTDGININYVQKIWPSKNGVRNNWNKQFLLFLFLWLYFNVFVVVLVAIFCWGNRQLNFWPCTTFLKLSIRLRQKIYKKGLFYCSCFFKISSYFAEESGSALLHRVYLLLNLILQLTIIHFLVSKLLPAIMCT